MFSGNLVTRSGKDDGPGFVCPVVNPSSHAQTWATGERKSWLDADPDEPPGPGVISVVRNWVFCGSKMIGNPWARSDLPKLKLKKRLL